MSIRQFFGNDIKPPKSGEIVQYVDEATGTIDIKNVTIDGLEGEENQVLASDGDGHIVWATGTGGGGISTDDLSDVMQRGNIAGADLEMADFSISGNNLNIQSTGNLVINAIGQLNLVAAAGYGFTNGIGEEGQILVSYADQGANWITPQIPEITSDLDMNGNGIVNIASITGVQSLTIGNAEAGGQITFSADSTAVFVETPLCDNIPTVDNQLVNKAYADSLVVQAGAVTLDGNNVFTGANTFNGGTAFSGDTTYYGASDFESSIVTLGNGSGACIITSSTDVDGSSYDHINTAESSTQIISSAGVTINAPLAMNYVMYVEETNGSFVNLPTAAKGYGGCCIKILTSASSLNSQFRGAIKTSLGSDFSSDNTYAGITIRSSHNIEFVCMEYSTNAWYWFAVSCTDAQLSYQTTV